MQMPRIVLKDNLPVNSVNLAPDVSGLRHFDRKPLEQVWIIIRSILRIMGRGDVAPLDTVGALLDEDRELPVIILDSRLSAVETRKDQVIDQMQRSKNGWMSDDHRGERGRNRNGC